MIVFGNQWQPHLPHPVKSTQGADDRMTRNYVEAR